MGRWLTALLVAATVAFGAGTASAQETTGASRWEVTGFPGGGILFTEGSENTGEPDFSNYALGGSLTYNWNQFWGIEGEAGAGIGIDQRLSFNDGRPSVGDASPPNMFAYNANALFGRWGVRGDYRFIAIDSKTDAPAFFGRADTRYGHRVYGGLIFGFGR